MHRTKRVPIAALIVGILAVSTGTALAGGLSTQLGEVVIENLQIGQTYNLHDLANLDLSVRNNGDYEIDLVMDPLVPAPGELKQGARAIPDLAWMALTENRHVIAPQGTATTQILLSIPNDERYLGRKFQVTIWSHSVPRPGAGMALAYGLKSRIIFTIDPVKADPVDVVTASTADAGCVITPQEIRQDEVAVGRLWDMEKESRVHLTVSNPGDMERKVRLTSQTVGASQAEVTRGYEDAPDASYLTFSENELVLAPGESRTVQMYLCFPADRKYSGRDFMFIVHAQSVGTQVSTGVYARVYASVR